jgi:hypothetical protein
MMKVRCDSLEVKSKEKGKKSVKNYGETQVALEKNQEDALVWLYIDLIGAMKSWKVII